MESKPRCEFSGKYFGNYHTKCHDGTLLPFRARCNKVKIIYKNNEIVFEIGNLLLHRLLSVLWMRMNMTVTGTKDTQLFLKLQTSHNFKSNNWLLKDNLWFNYFAVLWEKRRLFCSNSSLHGVLLVSLLCLNWLNFRKTLTFQFTR